jgi:hypothetical protein
LMRFCIKQAFPCIGLWSMRNIWHYCVPIDTIPVTHHWKTARVSILPCHDICFSRVDELGTSWNFSNY